MLAYRRGRWAFSQKRIMILNGCAFTLCLGTKVTCAIDGTKHLAPVVQKVDRAIRWINLYPVDNIIGFPNIYQLDSDLSGG